MDVIRTISGKDVLVSDFSEDDVCLSDIAHSLSLQCRFGGHCRHFYSVAQHSVLVSKVVPEEFALSALFHDAAEAYIFDIPEPIKRDLPEYQEAERRISSVIAQVFGVDFDHEEVKKADRLLLSSEFQALMCGPLPEGFVEPSKDLVNQIIPPMEWRRAKAAFLQRYGELST